MHVYYTKSCRNRSDTLGDVTWGRTERHDFYFFKKFRKKKINILRCVLKRCIFKTNNLLILKFQYRYNINPRWHLTLLKYSSRNQSTRYPTHCFLIRYKSCRYEEWSHAGPASQSLERAVKIITTALIGTWWYAIVPGVSQCKQHFNCSWMSL